MISLANSTEQAAAGAAAEVMLRAVNLMIGGLPSASASDADRALELGNALIAAAMLGLNEEVGPHLPTALRGAGFAMGFFLAQLPASTLPMFSDALSGGIADGMRSCREAFEPRGRA